MKKPRLADVNAALMAVLVAMLGALVALAALFYVFPIRHLFRGVQALAVIAAVVCGVIVSRRRR